MTMVADADAEASDPLAAIAEELERGLAERLDVDPDDVRVRHTSEPHPGAGIERLKHLHAEWVTRTADGEDGPEVRTDGGDETVYVRAFGGSGGNTRRIHTDRQCNRLNQARKVIAKERSVLNADAPECAECAGTIDYGEGGGRDHSRPQKLAAMNADEVGR